MTEDERSGSFVSRETFDQLSPDDLRAMLGNFTSAPEALPTFVDLRLHVKPYIGSGPAGSMILATFADLDAWHDRLRSDRGDSMHTAPRRDRDGAPITARWAYVGVGGWRLRLSASEPAPEEGHALSVEPAAASTPEGESTADTNTPGPGTEPAAA